MKRNWVVIIIVFSIVGMVWGQMHVQAYVMNGLAETLDVINLQTGVVTPNVEALGLWPNQIIYYHRFLLVVNSGYNNLQVIDPAFLNTIGTVEFGANHNPYYMCPLLDGRVAVSQLLDNSVSLVNLDSMQEEASISVRTGPEGICQHGSELFVAITNYSGGYLPGRVDVIDLTTNQVSDHIAVGINPQWIGLGQDGNLHVVCTGDYASVYGKIFVINPSNHQVVDSIAVGSAPGTWAMMESGIAYMGVSMWGGGGYLLAYNTLNHQVVHSEANPLQVGGGVMGVVAGEDNRLYICVNETDQVKVMDADESIIATYNVGDGPQSIALSPPIEYTPPKAEITPVQFYLGQNYPNPFNSVTIIPYQLPIGVDESYLKIVNVMGQTVRLLPISGTGNVVWDGRNQNGTSVSAGIYWVKMSGVSSSMIIKMVYLP
jgi:hypothetical protein